MDRTFSHPPQPHFTDRQMNTLFGIHQREASLLMLPRKGDPCTVEPCPLKLFLFQTPRDASATPTSNEQPEATYLHDKGHDEIGAEHNDNVDPPQDRSAEQLVGDEKAKSV